MFQATPFRCVMIACLLAFATSSMWAQTGSKSTKSSDAKTATTQKTEAEEEFRGRLPNNFGQIGLTPKQRAEIYAIQKKYHNEIDELEQRLASLKSQQAIEIHDILNEDQKKALKALQDKRKTASAKKTASTEE